MGMFEGTAEPRPSYMLGSPQYRVTAPVVVAQLAGGSERYVNRDGFLPVGTMQSQIEHLLSLGMITRFEAIA